jgi:hypothetical protein
MKRVFMLIATAFVFLTHGAPGNVFAQESPARIELGVQFSSMNFSNVPNGGTSLSALTTTEAGFGGRFTFNLNKHFALEAEGNFFPHRTAIGLANGTVLQGQAGVKVGQRFKHFGLFAKARPGIVSFSEVGELIDVGGALTFVEKRKQFFSLDAGGVIEFYPSRRILTRIDVGDTIIYHIPRSFFLSPFSGTMPATHNLQVSAGIGFRLLDPDKDDSNTSAPLDRSRKFEVGGQFSSLSVSVHERFFSGLSAPFEFRDTQTAIGFGGRVTYNVNSSFAVEGEGNFFPADGIVANRGRSGGRILQGQFGIKTGKRFQRFGIFAKARPGVISFGRTVKIDVVDNSQAFPIITFRAERSSYFSTDVGGVLEFYPSSRIVTRFDGGDTIIRYGPTRLPFGISPTIENIPPVTQHNFQFSAGVGVRF